MATKEFYGEFLINAQGEDVVAGVRLPNPWRNWQKNCPKPTRNSKKSARRSKNISRTCRTSSSRFRNASYMLQTRNGKRTAAAALKFSMDMVKEKLIDCETAVLRNPADQLDQLLAPIFDLAEVKKAKVIASGLPAGPGAACGKIYLNADRAVEAEKKRRKGAARPQRNLARRPARHDRGGRHHHRPRRRQFARGACRPPDGQGLCLRRRRLEIDYHKKTVTVAGQIFKEGDFLSIDGTWARSMPARSRRPRRKSSPASSTATKPRRAPRSSRTSTSS